MQYKNRREAGERLAVALAGYRGQDVVVYALPRGGVPLGYEVARALEAPLDVVIVRKIGHPFQPEWAACAVAEGGRLLCDEGERASLDPAWLKAEVEKEQQEAKRRREAYLVKKPHLPASGKVAIVVDDGVATGLSMLLAVDEVLSEHPRELVVAVPVTPREAAEKIRSKGATLVALQEPELYEGAVGAYYEEFPQVEDAEVIALLHNRDTL